MLFYRKPMRNVEEWLKVATHKLDPEDLPRIEAEIGEHYQAAYDDAISGGAGPDDAHRKAMISLGSPSSARRGFAKLSITNSERSYLKSADELQSSLRRWRRWNLLGGTVLAVLSIIFWLQPEAREFGSVFFGYFLFIANHSLVKSYLGFTRHTPLSRVEAQRIICILSLIRLPAWICPLSFALANASLDNTFFGLALLMLMFSVSGHAYEFRILHKLKRRERHKAADH